MMLTEDLERKLREEKDFDEQLVLGNKAPDIHILLNKHIAEKNAAHADIIRNLNVERCYGYQLLNGKRIPTRVQLIKIGLLLKLELDEIQKLLKVAGKEILYARNVTDAKVIHAIEHELPFDAACEFIWDK